eukprot:479210_1
MYLLSIGLQLISILLSSIMTFGVLMITLPNIVPTQAKKWQWLFGLAGILAIISNAGNKETFYAFLGTTPLDLNIIGYFVDLFLLTYIVYIYFTNFYNNDYF